MTSYTRQAAASVIMTNVIMTLGAIAVPTSFIGSLDLTVNQFVSLFNECGKDLATAFDWQELHKEYTITSTGVTSYALPSDFNGFVNDAGWDSSQRWPAVGQISPQIWRMLKARVSSGSWAMIAFRIVQDQIVFFNAPATGDTLTFDYYSAGWLRSATDPTAYYDNLQADSNICLLDSRLMESFLKLKWRAAKGFDTISAKEEFLELFDAVAGRNVPGPTLSVSPSQREFLLDYSNIPDTNYGS